ncbi:pectin methylesterase, family CE8 [Zostera marina]|uniref:Pectinesterase n=1 Tax=Zostera marina TaxID=29655 RepID=A0A0K9NY36_ZOSMR|nr:pectin methylesterase, family CE8 [Zostera marina]
MQNSNGYGQVNGGQKKQPVTMVIVSSLVLVAMVVAVAVGVSHYQKDNNNSGEPNKEPPNTSIKAIQSICQPTDYKETCEKSITSAAGSNTTDPKKLVGISFKVAMEHIHNVLAESKTMEELQKDPRNKKALEVCQETLEYSIDDLQRSLEKVDSFDLKKINTFIEDLRVWLSASSTFQETCLDAFENTTGDAGAKMKKAMNTTAELTENALAIVDGVSSILGNLQIPGLTGGRKLLGSMSLDPQDGVPSWLTDGKRKLLVDPNIKPDITVAQDGSGDFKTINEAVQRIPLSNATQFIVYIKKGIYKERVEISKKMINVMFVGDGQTATVITGNLNFIDGTPTFKTCTLAVVGNGFIGKDIGIENSAGAEKHQAVALRVQSDNSVFYRCQMDGYQDTLYCHSHRQFYRECTISGTIDYVFGNSETVLQKCIFSSRKPLSNQRNIVTAQGRKGPREPTALVLQDCSFVADPGLEPFKKQNPTFLGRPWKEFSRTIIMQCQIGDVIDPIGWLPWFGDFGLNTCYYAEYDNRGMGSVLTERATWRGIKTNGFGYDAAEQYTVENYLEGNDWLKTTGVPYFPGMLPVAHSAPANSGPVAGVVGPAGK